MSNNTISILMSVYNETLEYLQQSVDSMLKQTYSDIELIIVVDDPNVDKKIKDYLMGLPQKVIVIFNDKNIGLAMSMNKAFKASSGKYIARMDADDISVLTRLEKELHALLQFKADLVCSDYDLIDENSNELENNYVNYNNQTLIKRLPFSNTIHHPTVLMTRDAFATVQGYRNFPCSQDYDLWLRMLDKHMKFYILKEKLLKYRIRTTSITQKNGMKQSLTIRYIKKLFRERFRKGKDSYSLSNYDKYLRAHGFYNKNVIKKYNDSLELKSRIDSLRGHSKIRRSLMKMMLLCKSPFHRSVYFYNIADLILEKLNIYKSY